MDTPVYTVVIPVYRSEKTLDELCCRLREVFDNEIKAHFEVILVDDGSPDASWQKLEQIHAKDERFKVIQLARNFGQHNALMCGFHFVRGDFVITMDDDLQHPPEEIVKLVDAFKADPGVDMIIGAYDQKQHSLWRNWGSRISRWLGHKLFQRDTSLRFSSFRLVRALTVKSILDVQMQRPRVGQLLLQMSNRVINAPVNHDPRRYGRSGYTFCRLVKDFMNNILNNSSLPLQCVSWIGIASAFSSFILAAYYVYRYFFIGISIAGWTTLVLLLLFYFGVMLLSIGIIGEYLIKIIKESKRMPQYVIKNQRTTP